MHPRLASCLSICPPATPFPTHTPPPPPQSSPTATLTTPPRTPLDRDDAPSNTQVQQLFEELAVDSITWRNAHWLSNAAGTTAG